LLYTTYENCTYCKPSEGYYREVLAKIGCAPSECLMVGNDVTDDMVPASAVGMQVFLLTDYLINKNGADIGVYKNGGYDELLAYIASL
ncbi:MAG: HAD hydrolase-like protein, partial [Clostridia bacterium]|nr:HAD hydrolase-like protein [Clostridia bacterium]